MVKAVIDRIEGNIAIVLMGDDEIQVDIPKTSLPKGCKEGDWLTVSFELDPKETSDRKERISQLLSKLKNRG